MVWLAGRADLLRNCERRGASGRDAASLFWTLGGNQVGKAALNGWRTILKPALGAGARLWPYDGAMEALLAAGGVVICETYPTEAAAQIGVRLPRGAGKGSREARKVAGEMMRAWVDRRGIAFRADAARQVDDGFDDDDAYDAMLGLLGMIEVVDGHRAAAPALSEDEAAWEGWILGKVRPPAAASVIEQEERERGAPAVIQRRRGGVGAAAAASVVDRAGGAAVIV